MNGKFTEHTPERIVRGQTRRGVLWLMSKLYLVEPCSDNGYFERIEVTVVKRDLPSRRLKCPILRAHPHTLFVIAEFRSPCGGMSFAYERQSQGQHNEVR